MVGLKSTAIAFTFPLSLLGGIGLGNYLYHSSKQNDDDRFVMQEKVQFCSGDVYLHHVNSLHQVIDEFRYRSSPVAEDTIAFCWSTVYDNTSFCQSMILPYMGHEDTLCQKVGQYCSTL